MLHHSPKVPILTRCYFRWLKSSGICLAGEERIRHISIRIVGDNLKGETAPLSFEIPSGGEEIKGAPLYTFHS